MIVFHRVLVHKIALEHLFIGEMNAESVASQTVCSKKDGAALAAGPREPRTTDDRDLPAS
jgi:hypothetical protein